MTQDKMRRAAPSAAQVAAHQAPVPRKRLTEKLEAVRAKIDRLERQRYKYETLLDRVRLTTCVYKGVPLQQFSLDVTAVAGEAVARKTCRDPVYSSPSTLVLRFEWVRRATCGVHDGTHVEVRRFEYLRRQQARALKDAKTFVATGQYPKKARAVLR